MVHIVFEYADQLSNWEWRKQECTVRSLEECIRIYGLGVDCKYRILSVTPVDQAICHMLYYNCK